MAQPAPRVSILIPNYNNGRESSRDGDRDFLADLFRSLVDTLEDDPTPVEILVADDGSTDDSLHTARVWAEKTWKSGERFCSLEEDEHTGVLSVVANRLTARARGEFCCRLDGDIVINTSRWAERLVETFEQGPPTLGVIGPKQLIPNGTVHSAGDFVLHPRGYHHVGQGLPPAAVTRTLEVDHVMGCFYCHRRALWEELGGYDETILRGQTIDFGLRARLHGWRAFAVPHIEFVHLHTLRADRPTPADTRDGFKRTLDRFYEKWGFDRVAPDLEVVRERYAGTPLLWNPLVFGPALEPPPIGGALDIRQTEWAEYAANETFRATVDRRIETVGVLGLLTPPRGRVLNVGSRSGLLCHLLAQRGFEMIGVEADPDRIELARIATADQIYDAPRPEFVHQPDERRLPSDDGAVDCVLLFDVLETNANPVGLLRECRRVLSEAGIIGIVTRERTRPLALDEPGYTTRELWIQLHCTRCFTPISMEELPDIPGSVVMLGRRRPEEPFAAQVSPPLRERAGAAAVAVAR